MSEEQKINKNMTIGEAISKYPRTAEVLGSHGFHCVGCPATAMETIEQGAKAHGKSDKEIEAIIKEMNEAVSVGD